MYIFNDIQINKYEGNQDLVKENLVRSTNQIKDLKEKLVLIEK